MALADSKRAREASVDSELEETRVLVREVSLLSGWLSLVMK